MLIVGATDICDAPGQMDRTASSGAQAASIAAPGPGAPDAETQAWITDLESDGPGHDRAVAALHDVLMRAARREAERRRGSIPDRVAADLTDLVRQAADDALVAVLAKLPTYRGQSRFTTWAWKFAIYEISVALRREAWRGRSIGMDASDWDRLVDRRPIDPAAETEARELVAAVRRSVSDTMTAHQREVFVAVVVDDVPIDVLADRLGSTRNAMYKTLHDARGRLRADLAAQGWPASRGRGARS
jgi:RNA polymerase sigma-70 factor (ECF subfamily)